MNGSSFPTNWRVAWSLWISSYWRRLDVATLYSSAWHPVIFWINFINALLCILFRIHIIYRSNSSCFASSFVLYTWERVSYKYKWVYEILYNWTGENDMKIGLIIAVMHTTFKAVVIFKWLKPEKNFRPERDSKTWTLRHRCSALPTEHWTYIDSIFKQQIVFTWRHRFLKSKTKAPPKFLSSSGIRDAIFISVYNFTAH